jgi:hypothetical protein
MAGQRQAGTLVHAVFPGGIHQQRYLEARRHPGPQVAVAKIDAGIELFHRGKQAVHGFHDLGPMQRSLKRAPGIGRCVMTDTDHL